MTLDIYQLAQPLQRKYGEDTVQDALLHLWRYTPEAFDKPPVEFAKYLRRVARHKKAKELVRANKAPSMVSLESLDSKQTREADVEYENEENSALAVESLNVEHIATLRDYQRRTYPMSRMSRSRFNTQLRQT